MSVSSSHLDPSSPHTSSQSNSLSIEVLGTRWFPTDCHHNISGFLYTLVLLLPQRTQSEWAHKPNLDMNITAVNPMLQHTMVRHPLMHVWGHKVTIWHLDKYYVTATFLVYSTYVFHLCWCMTVCLQPTGLVFGRVKITAFTRLQV